MSPQALLIFGTRPEAIKLAPVYHALRESALAPIVCVTAQHRSMLDQVLRFFEIAPDIDLNLMRHDQAPYEVLGTALAALVPVVQRVRPVALIVQGDTTTTLAGALAGFYTHTPVGHVEAGLRTYDHYAPFPEEVNRELTSRVADLHFAPTVRAEKALRGEGIPSERIVITGNTVVDAFRWAAARVAEPSWNAGGLPEALRALGPERRVVLVTAHRRESFGQPFEELCAAIRELAARYPDVLVVYPVHLNPRVQDPVQRILGGIENVLLCPPLDYASLVWVLSHSYLVLTDSGGIQEEAPSLGVPALVMRETTERPEGIEAGVAKLVGTSRAKIVGEAARLLDNPGERAKISSIENPYGDGRAGERIRDLLVTRFAP
jgi:UDP-N-acetylglucosamine 2-epimerase (non-hydrolysing)